MPKLIFTYPGIFYYNKVYDTCSIAKIHIDDDQPKTIIKKLQSLSRLPDKVRIEGQSIEYYINSEILSKRKIKSLVKQYKELKCLLDFMEKNNIDQMYKCQSGSYYPVEKDSKVLNILIKEKK